MVLTLIGIVISLPLVYWIEPNTGAGTTLLVVVILLATNVAGGLSWRPRQKPSAVHTPPDR